MAQSFNELQGEVQKAAVGLHKAREKLRVARTELIAEHRKIAHLAHHDALTDLPNRNIISLKMNAALARIRPGERIALLLLDLDNFKTINDTLGHSAGDELLIAVAERLRRAVPDSDTIARLGGDEFAVLLAGSGLPGRASYLARRMIEALRHPVQIGAKEVVCNVSIGIAMAPDHALDAADLFRFADLALYSAKEEKGGTFRFFRSEMDEKIRARSSLERELRHAIDNNELEVHYQPVISLETNAPAYVEALVRWRHPERGLIPPGKFIPLAEETSMIADIGEFVLRSACRDAASWPAEVSVAVNVSAHELAGTKLIDTIEGSLKNTGLPSGRLQLEVTESALMKDVEHAMKTISEITKLGIEVAIDDFGTGYSSLSSLRSFPFKRLKIDRAFVKDLEQSEEACAILATIVDLAKTLGMRTTAEGVETIEQLEIVKKYGCTTAQGFLFYKPMPLSQLSPILHGLADGSKSAA